MNNKALLSTTYLGPVQYYAKLATYNECIIEQHENYSKQSYRNRATILDPNGPLDLSIPVSKTGNGKCLVKNIRLTNADNWQTIHWRAFHAAYTNSPYYEFYIDELRPFYHQEYQKLLDFNLRLQNVMIDLLELDVNISLTDSFMKHLPGDIDDFRYTIHPKENHRMEDGNFNAKPYTQVFSDRHSFVANLSILDLLFNLGPGAKDYLLACYSRQ